MSFITLTSDFGHKDYFVAATKGAIYTLLPEANIIDISHDIEPFSIAEASYILKNSYKNFPKGTIHIIGVDAELTPENKHLAIYLDEHYFLCADNGIMSLITSEIKPTKIVEINIHDRLESNFTILNTFINVACFLAKGGSLDVIGKPLQEFKIITEIQPNISNDIIKGSVIYIDGYGNVVTNITKNIFQQTAKGRKFKIHASKFTLKKIVNNYSDIIDFSIPSKDRKDYTGEALALFNAGNFLEISLYKSNKKTIGGATNLLGLSYRSPIIVEIEASK